MRVAIIPIIFLALLACEPALDTVPTDEYVPSFTEQNLEEPIEQEPVELEVEEEPEPEIKCEFGEVEKEGECVCAEDRRWCGEQNKCIKKGSCCVHSQCDGFERCVPTQLRTSVCAETENKTTCRLLADIGRSDLITINGLEIRLEPQVWTNEGVEILFNEDNVTVTEEIIKYKEISFYHEGFEEFGGYCKEDEDD